MQGRLSKEQIEKVNAGASIFVPPSNPQETNEWYQKMKEMDTEVFRLYEALKAAKAGGTEADIAAAQAAYDSYMEIYEPTMNDYVYWRRYHEFDGN